MDYTWTVPHQPPGVCGCCRTLHLFLFLFGWSLSRSLAVSLVGLIVDLADRQIGGWLSLNLRCIVVEATQVFQSGLVAELVLVLRGRKPTTVPLNPPPAQTSAPDQRNPRPLPLR